MILSKKKNKITEEEIQKKGRLKTYSDKILSVQTDRIAAGFTQEDISEVRTTINQLTRELNERILSMFKMKSDSKLKTLREKMDYNAANYEERNAVFRKELQEMNDRFDYLKRAEQRDQDVMDYAIVYKEQKRIRRMCFDCLKYYAHTQKNVRAVMTLYTREWPKTSKLTGRIYSKNVFIT